MAGCLGDLCGTKHASAKATSAGVASQCKSRGSGQARNSAFVVGFYSMPSSFVLIVAKRDNSCDLVQQVD
jgi:hypothetical protein